MAVVKSSNKFLHPRGIEAHKQTQTQRERVRTMPRNRGKKQTPTLRDQVHVQEEVLCKQEFDIDEFLRRMSLGDDILEEVKVCQRPLRLIHSENDILRSKERHSVRKRKEKIKSDSPESSLAQLCFSETERDHRTSPVSEQSKHMQMRMCGQEHMPCST
jgi:hypothetical protein